MLDVIYKGVSLSSIGFDYIPTAQQRGDAVTVYQVVNESYTSRDGGVRYGARTEIKKFEIKLFYEDITTRQKERLIRLVDRRTGGELYFAERPYARYIAYPSQKPTFEEYGHYARIEGRRYSGVATIYFDAYMPFASLTEKYLDTLVEVNSYSNLLDETSMVVSTKDPMYEYISSAAAKPGEYIYDLPTTNTTSWNLKVLYPGTEFGRLSFDVAGTVGESGLTIYNGTSGQTCKVMGLTSTITDSQSRWYHVDAENGQCYLTNGISKDVDYEFHDNGYISLIPADINRDVRLQTESGSSDVLCENGDFDEDIVGRYVFIDNEQDNKWRLIGGYVSPNEITLSSTASETADIITDIVKMNIITITGGPDTSLSRLRLYIRGYVR